METRAVMPPKPPKPETLRKYGLDEQEWLALLAAQGNVCAVCRKVPENGRLCTDHEHCKGWKHAPPEERKKWVRGMLCYFCNHWYVGRAITVTKAENVLTYLKAFEQRRPNASPKKAKKHPRRTRRGAVSVSSRGGGESLFTLWVA